MEGLDKKLSELQESRQSVYGDWRDNMDGTSMQIEGLLRNAPKDRHVPWLTPLVMCAVKLNRIATGNFHQDNFDDLRVYLKFVEEMQRCLPKV